MKKPSMKELRAELLRRLSHDDPGWVDQAQDKQAEALEEAEKLLEERGLKPADPDNAVYGDLLEELAEEVAWIPGHWAATVVVNMKAGRKR